MIFLPPRWDMLIPWRLHFFPTFFLVGHVSAWFFSWSLGEIDAQRGSFFFLLLPIFRGISCHWIWELIARFDTMSSKRPPFWTHWQKRGGQGRQGVGGLIPIAWSCIEKIWFFQSYQFCRYIHLRGLNHGMLPAIYLHQDTFALASLKKTTLPQFLHQGHEDRPKADRLVDGTS